MRRTLVWILRKVHMRSSDCHRSIITFFGENPIWIWGKKRRSISGYKRMPFLKTNNYPLLAQLEDNQYLCRRGIIWSIFGSFRRHSYWSFRSDNWMIRCGKERKRRADNRYHGQWWSILRMQRWHMRQWWARGGRYIWHRTQTDQLWSLSSFLDNNCLELASKPWAGWGTIPGSDIEALKWDQISRARINWNAAILRAIAQKLEKLATDEWQLRVGTQTSHLTAKQSNWWTHSRCKRRSGKWRSDRRYRTGRNADGTRGSSSVSRWLWPIGGPLGTTLTQRLHWSRAELKWGSFCQKILQSMPLFVTSISDA